MNEIIFNGSNFECSETSLPLLIHGEDKAGASLFTITFATNLFAKGSKLLFLTGYEMAKEEFIKQTRESYTGDDRVIFCLKNEATQFTQNVNTLSDINDRVVIIKNIDLFDEKIFDLISGIPNIIISGDINKCAFKEKILDIKFETEVLFSELEGKKIPQLEKYQGFLTENNISGITTVKIN